MLDNNVFLGELTRKELGEVNLQRHYKRGDRPNGCHRTASRPSGDDSRYRLASQKLLNGLRQTFIPMCWSPPPFLCRYLSTT